MARSTTAALCPAVESAFHRLGRKWTGLVVHALASSARRFCEIEQAIPGLSARVLAARLRDLERDGIVTRTVDTGSPVRVVYALTGKGRALVPVMKGIESWARTWTAPSARARR